MSPDSPYDWNRIPVPAERVRLTADELRVLLMTHAKCVKANAAESCLCDECCFIAEFCGSLINGYYGFDFGRPSSTGRWQRTGKGSKPRMVGKRR